MPRRYVSGKVFYTDEEYEAACRDDQKIKQLEEMTDLSDPKQLMELYGKLQTGEIRFESELGIDFDDHIFGLVQQLKQAKEGSRSAENGPAGKQKTHTRGSASKAEKRTQKDSAKTSGAASANTAGGGGSLAAANSTDAQELDRLARDMILRREKRRKLITILCVAIAVLSLGYFGIYGRSAIQNEHTRDELSRLKGTNPVADVQSEVEIHYTDESVSVPDILDEYKNLYIKNKSIIGWLEIADTNIDYPVMQTTNNEYYLTHNFDGEEDKNGCLFLDADCDVIRRSTNLIIYGHHMKSGKMFGALNKYSSVSYYEKHPVIQFDTIYEKGTYQIIYVFRDKIQSEASVEFKYYQFINAGSAEEFNSNMQQMAMMSLYSTGQTAAYGDQLLTLSTCDSSEKGGRFVVVAKRIS